MTSTQISISYTDFRVRVTWVGLKIGEYGKNVEQKLRRQKIPGRFREKKILSE